MDDEAEAEAGVRGEAAEAPSGSEAAREARTRAWKGGKCKNIDAYTI
jgi:hypothetical protein